MKLTFGIELEFVDIRTVFLRKHLPQGWECQGDNSLQNTDGSWSNQFNPMALGSEVKTQGGYELETLVAQIPSIYETVAGLGGTVNKTCGLHVHVGIEGSTPDLILPLMRYFASSPSFGKAVGASAKRRGRQCMRITAKEVQMVAETIHDLDNLAKISARAPFQHVHLRQLEVNVLSLLHHGTVEYRAFNQTMNPDLAINCIRYADEVTRAALAGDLFPLPTYPLPEAL